MVLGILTAIAACPAVIGTTEAVRQGQRQNAREKHRGLKTNLSVNCSRVSSGGREIDGCAVVLNNDKVRRFLLRSLGEKAAHSRRLQTGAPRTILCGILPAVPGSELGPAGRRHGLDYSNDPPQLNWIYVNQDTCQVKYGDHVASEPHITGSWDMTKMDRGAMLTGWEGFMAVRYCPGEWALYFDVDDNGLKGVVGDEMLRVEVELARLRPPEPRLQRTITRNDEE